MSNLPKVPWGVGTYPMHGVGDANCTLGLHGSFSHTDMAKGLCSKAVFCLYSSYFANCSLVFLISLGIGLSQVTAFFLQTPLVYLQLSKCTVVCVWYRLVIKSRTSFYLQDHETFYFFWKLYSCNWFQIGKAMASIHTNTHHSCCHNWADFTALIFDPQRFKTLKSKTSGFVPFEYMHFYFCLSCDSN